MSLLTTVNGRGLLSARPAAAAANEGYIYSASDAALYRSNGSSWDTIGGNGIVDTGTLATYLDVADQGSDPSSPSAGNHRFYAKSGGLYVKDSGGTVVGALGAGGGGGGGLVFLQKQNASASATLDFASWYSATYDEYLIEFVSLVMANNSVNLLWRASTDTGATYDSGTNYAYDNFVFRSGGSATGGGAGQSALLVNYSGTTINNGTAAQASISGWMRLYSPASTALNKLVEGMTTYFDSGGFRVANMFRGAYESTTAMDAFRVLASSGNITSGSVRVYGVAKA